MIGKRFLAVTILASILLGFQISNIYVPDGFENPTNYRIIHVSIRIISYLARVKSALGYGLEATNFREIARYMTVEYQDDEVKTEFITINNIEVKIFRPKSFSNQNSYPVMLHFHGGGFYLGSPSGYDLYLFEFVKNLNMIVISVAYRLAPEYTYPTVVDDCYAVTKYVIENPVEFSIDPNRLMVAGDSAGGNAVAVVAQRFLREGVKLPKIQLLIYPWLQLVTSQLPACIRYIETGITGAAQIGFKKMIPWYLGITNITTDIENIFDNDELIAYLKNDQHRQRILSYLNTDKIPAMYKKDTSYYETTNLSKKTFKLSDSSILKRDGQLANEFMKLFDPDASPLLAPDANLKGLPKTYLLSVEWDFFKDEGLLYAQRLKEAGVDVEIAFYPNGFHGMSSMIDEYGYQLSRDMQAHLLNYLKNNL